jgi:hypothetical protein
MKRLRVVVMLLAAMGALSVVLSGCDTDSTHMDAWMGKNKSDLILAWGAPDRVMSDGKDGEVLIYERMVKRGFTSANAQVHTYGTSTYGTGSAVTTTAEGKRYRMFWADKNGVLYHWKGRGAMRNP